MLILSPSHFLYALLKFISISRLYGSESWISVSFLEKKTVQIIKSNRFEGGNNMPNLGINRWEQPYFHLGKKNFSFL